MKVCLVGSSGGHLTHLYMLKPFWQDKERFWVTFDKEDARTYIESIHSLAVESQTEMISKLNSLISILHNSGKLCFLGLRR